MDKWFEVTMLQTYGTATVLKNLGNQAVTQTDTGRIKDMS
jgi:hypothetical protein